MVALEPGKALAGAAGKSYWREADARQVVKAWRSSGQHRWRTGLGPVSTNQRVFFVIGILALLVGVAMLLGLPQRLP
jgi:hypothetical protein